MSSPIVSYIKGGFVPDFTRAYPCSKNSLELFVNPRVSIIFSDIFSPESKDPMNFEQFMKETPDMDSSSLHKRISRFVVNRSDRLERYFLFRGDPIFFYEEEIGELSRVFQSGRFVARIEFKIDNREFKFENIPKVNKQAVINELNGVGAIFPVEPEEYKNMTNTVRYKKLVSIKKKREAKVMKKKLLLKAIGGSLMIATSAIGLIFGGKLVSDSIDIATGKDREVVLIENE